MRGWSKAVGAGLGYFVGGPIGAILGYMAGNKLAPKLPPKADHLFTANILGFTAVLLRAEGHASEEERRETVFFLSRLFRFDGDDEHFAHQLLDRLLDVDLDTAAMARTFKRLSDPEMRQRLMEILSTICLLHRGGLRGIRLNLLSQTAAALDLNSAQWDAIRARYQAPSPTLDLDCCYALLGLYPEAAAEEIRAAYRRLAKKHHPDRSAFLDNGDQRPNMERMTLINGAYETIRAERRL